MPIEMVHFIEDGLVVTTSANESDQGPVGAWIAGREGVVCGVPVALGVFTSPHKRVVISRGESLAIREDIRAGRYQVNPERIADGLIDSVRDLLNGKKPS